jgi:hypothetical protein
MVTMDTKEIRFDLHGFEAGSSFGPFLKSVVTRLHLAAPRDAQTTACFTKTLDSVSGAILISSSRGVFSARVQGRNAHTVARMIAKELGRQLEKIETEDLSQKVQSRGHLRLVPQLHQA